MMLFKLLGAHLKPYRTRIAAIVGLQLVATAASLYLPSLNADIIDNGVAHGDTGYIWRTGGSMLGVTLVQVICHDRGGLLRRAHRDGVRPRHPRRRSSHRVADVLRARGRPVRRAVADHPHHQRRPAGADARADDLHHARDGTDHVRRRHHHGAARGPRAVVAAGRGGRRCWASSIGAHHRRDGAAVPAACRTRIDARQPRAARADHRHPGGPGVRPRAARDARASRRQRRPHRRPPCASGRLMAPIFPMVHADHQRLERRACIWFGGIPRRRRRRCRSAR